MSDDLIEKLRREAAEKTKQAKVPEPWVIERQKEDEQRERDIALGKQYFQESGCRALCEKLAAFLNSQNPNADASLSEERILNDYIVIFSWNVRELWFRIAACSDGSLIFNHLINRDRRIVTLTEWRANKSKVESALEFAYRSAVDHSY